MSEKRLGFVRTNQKGVESNVERGENFWEGTVLMEDESQ